MTTIEPPCLFPSEVLDQVTNSPCLYRYFPGDKDKPLVVLIPGGAHTARIFYGGHFGYDPEDFLVPWLTRMGFGALGISYPLESEPTLMPAVAPGFRINEWGSQAAAVSKIVVDENRLCGEIVLVSWSMGGRLLVPYSKAAQKQRLKLKLFVSLSATPGIPGIRPPPTGRRNTKAGYATFSTMPELFMAQLREQEQINNNKVIIPPEIYYSQYYGHTPVSLLGWGLKYNGKGGFIDDNGGSVEDSAAHDFAYLPWISTLWPTSQLDARHSLSDKATWAFLLTQKLTAMFEDRPQSTATISRWSDIIQFVHSAPGTLSASVRGSHYFFLGRSGAKATAEAIIQHLSTANALQSQWNSLIEEGRLA
ncbi:hypothetical protein V494_03761 [Pseudogymnoascus sp. VKM F-4513 (FW-928)]|nr:hypothetical protein V494_03761 [Pseudogymnoascus sp. VKM F-4513 (FW-928)]